MKKLTEVFKLAAPLSAAQFAQSAMMFCDTVLLSLLGVPQLAGGGLGAGIYHLFVIIVTGLFAAVCTEVAILAGQRKLVSISRIVKAGLVLSFLLALLVALLIMVTPDLLALAGQKAVTITYADQYLSAAVWISFPAFAFLVLRGLAAGMGYTTSIMRISMLALGVNIPVSYFLMTGWDNFLGLGLEVLALEGMGVAGVALGTMVGSTVMLVLLAMDLWRYDKTRRILKALKSVRLRLVDFKPFWTLGMPIALAWVMETGLFTTATLLAGTLSVAALAAHQIALQSSSLAFNVYIGFAQGAAIRSGQCFGQKNMANVRRYTVVGLILGGLFCLVAALIFVVLPDPIVALFSLGAAIDLDTQVRDLGIQLLLVAALFQIVDGGQVIIMTALRAMRVGVPPTLIAFVGYWVIGFPVAWLLMTPFGIVGVWAGLGIGLAFTCVCLAVLFVWKTNKLSLLWQASKLGNAGHAV